MSTEAKPPQRGTLVLSTVLIVTLISVLGWESVQRQREMLQAQIEAAKLQQEGAQLRRDFDFEHMMRERYQAIYNYSTVWQIPANVAAMIYDIALSEGIEPELGFSLVDVESAFNASAISDKGAIGYAQVLLSTAREMAPEVTLTELFDPETNLHLGFRYLHQLLDEYNGDVRLALLSYNRGPRRVQSLLAMGEDPSNGYAMSVCGGSCSTVISGID